MNSATRDRLFFLQPNEIEQLLLCDSSDNDEEVVTKLDEEDVVFLENDVLANQDDRTIEIVIEDAKPVASKKARIDRAPVLAAKGPVPGRKPALFIPPEKVFPFRGTNTYKQSVFTGYQEHCAYQHSQILKPTVHVHEDMPPAYDVFNTVCNFEELCIMIVEQSNLFALQKGCNFTLTVSEFKAYMGIIIRMSLVKLPNIRLYWSTDPTFHQAQIADVMPRLRFEEITSNLHFCDNDQADVSDRGYKIRPIINHINKVMPAAYTYSKKLSIEFKGHNAMKQYMKNKPVSWGFKLWCLCESETGYLYKVDIYTGKKQFLEHGLGESVVLQLCEPLAKKGVEVYFDNFFTSVKLMYILQQNGIMACGTIRSNRKDMPKQFPADREMKRGDICCYTSDSISVVKCMDNRSVQGRRFNGVYGVVVPTRKIPMRMIQSFYGKWTIATKTSVSVSASAESYCQIIDMDKYVVRIKRKRREDEEHIDNAIRRQDDSEVEKSAASFFVVEEIDYKENHLKNIIAALTLHLAEQNVKLNRIYDKLFGKSKTVFNFPVRNVEDMKKLDEQLITDGSFEANLKVQMNTILTGRISSSKLFTIISDDLLPKINWDGRRNKFALKNTRFFGTTLYRFLELYYATYGDYEQDVKNAVKRGKNRLNQQKFKAKGPTKKQ